MDSDQDQEPPQTGLEVLEDALSDLMTVDLRDVSCPACSGSLIVKIDEPLLWENEDGSLTTDGSRSTGYVMCDNPECPRKTAASELLDPMVVGKHDAHFIVIKYDEDNGFEWTAQHPAIERLDRGKAMEDCRVGELAAVMIENVRAIGRFEVHGDLTENNPDFDDLQVEQLIPDRARDGS